jgi:hypothetical protein
LVVASSRGAIEGAVDPACWAAEATAARGVRASTGRAALGESDGIFVRVALSAVEGIVLTFSRHHGQVAIHPWVGIWQVRQCPLGAAHRRISAMGPRIAP